MTTLEDILCLDDRELAFYQLVHYYEMTSDNEREYIRDHWEFEKNWIFPNPETLTIQQLSKYSCKKRLFASTMFYSIDNFKSGRRESILGMAVDYHSAIELGMDPNELFERVARLSSTEMAKALRDFVNRQPEEKSLKAFDINRIVREDGVYFIKDWCDDSIETILKAYGKHPKESYKDN